MKVVSEDFVKDKKVLLRLDLDVPVGEGKVLDDYRLKAGLSTLNLCLQHSAEVIILGHLGRPEGKRDDNLSVAPIYQWLKDHGFDKELESGKLKLLENLRFEAGEDSGDLGYAKSLASLGDVFVNEAFAAYRPASSTTVLPTLLPASAGLTFAKEVETLTKVYQDPKQPLVVILGGAKVDDKLPVILALQKIAASVLVGGKLALEIKLREDIGSKLNEKVKVAKLNETGLDVTSETISEWSLVIGGAKMILWNGPVGKIEEEGNDMSLKLAKEIIASQAESIIGGGDTVGYLDKHDLLDKFSFVSTGGGAMLKFLETGTLPSIEALSSDSGLLDTNQ